MMTKNDENKILIFMIILALLIVLSLASTTKKISSLQNQIDVLEKRIETIDDEQKLTREILDAHLADELSKDIGGEY